MFFRENLKNDLEVKEVDVKVPRGLHIIRIIIEIIIENHKKIDDVIVRMDQDRLVLVMTNHPIIDAIVIIEKTIAGRKKSLQNTIEIRAKFTIDLTGKNTVFFSGVAKKIKYLALSCLPWSLIKNKG